MRMRIAVLVAFIAGAAYAWQSGAVASGPWEEQQGDDDLRYSEDNKMIRPGNYREWVWLSSGLGMSYSAGTGENANPEFDNVFVSRSAYKTFTKSGKWPDRTVFILENRQSQSKGSINQSGHFQSELDSVEAHVKDERRFKDKWAFYSFGKDKKTAAAIPRDASCYSCHAQHAAVDTTFVQFYPTLLTIAKAQHTLGNY